VLDATEVRVIDDQGQPLALGETGEFVTRGPFNSPGYYGEPALTAAAFKEDGWFHTGDLGRLDSNGYLYFEGRLKDLIKVGGENVTAAEIEDFLMSHPAVKLAQVVPVPDPRYAEVPAAFIELFPGIECDEDDIRSYCDGRISRVRIPKYIRFVSEWPMSTTKVRKVDLRAQLISELGLS
jgi:acyl-CoA synthetase (AMP-forming)/AMP-acid ligase II